MWSQNRTSALLQMTFVQRVILCLNSIFIFNPYSQSLKQELSRQLRESKTKRRELHSEFWFKIAGSACFPTIISFTASVGTIYSLCWGNTYYMCSLLSRISLKPLNRVQTVKKAWLCWTLLCARNADFFWPLSPLVVTITKITAFN